MLLKDSPSSYFSMKPALLLNIGAPFHGLEQPSPWESLYEALEMDGQALVFCHYSKSHAL